VLDVDRAKVNVPYHPDGSRQAAVVWVPNGEELLPLARAALGVGPPRDASVADWFLSDFERRNAATRLRTWTAAFKREHGDVAAPHPVLGAATVRQPEPRAGHARALPIRCAPWRRWRCRPRRR
jgi:hypothetical protein